MFWNKDLPATRDGACLHQCRRTCKDTCHRVTQTDLAEQHAHWLLSQEISEDITNDDHRLARAYLELKART